MPTSIGCTVNFFNEVNALPGFLESASAFFDSITVMDCGPNGTPSTDGSLDILRKWGITPHQGNINEGFGVVRTKLLRLCKADWIVILDADERMHVTQPVLDCAGTEGYPAVQNPKLMVTERAPGFNHKAFLLEKITEAESKNAVAVLACRRHWFSFDWKQPTQNWMNIPDYQLRIWKNVPHVGYKSDVAMHEQAWDFQRNCGPTFAATHQWLGPFIDHYHLKFKRMEPEQREHDIRIYNALHHGQPVPSV